MACVEMLRCGHMKAPSLPVRAPRTPEPLPRYPRSSVNTLWPFSVCSETYTDSRADTAPGACFPLPREAFGCRCCELQFCTASKLSSGTRAVLQITFLNIRPDCPGVCSGMLLLTLGVCWGSGTDSPSGSCQECDLLCPGPRWLHLSVPSCQLARDHAVGHY